MIPSLEIGGGAEKNAYNLGLRLSEKYDIQYLKFYNFENEYDVGKKCYSHNEKHGKSWLTRIIFILKRLIFIKKVLDKYKPNLVISFGFYSNLFVSLVSLKRNYRVILSVRSNISRLNAFLRNLSSFLYNKMDATHAITKKMQETLISLGVKNTVLIYNGHNLKLYRSLANEPLPTDISDDKYVYLNIGRLSYAKGQWHLLKSFSICAKKNPDAILIIIGEGELKKELESLIHSLDIKGRVFIFNNTSNIFPYIKRADCFCFTSIYEGLPNVLIETISMGTPIIATDCISGPREILFPELDVRRKIKYPHQSGDLILTTPFPGLSADMSTNIQKLEKEYAAAMDSIRLKISHNADQRHKANIFSEDLIVRKWDQLIEKQNEL